MKVTKETGDGTVRAFIVLDNGIEVGRMKILLEATTMDPAWTADMRKFVRTLEEAL